MRYVSIFIPQQTTMRLLSLLFLCCFFYSCTEDLCGDKDKFIQNFEQLVSETKEASSDYKEADWTKVEEKFQQLTKDCYQAHKEEMTMKEKRMFWKDAVKLMIVKGTEGIDLKINDEEVDIELGSSEEDLEYISNELEEVFEGTGEELKEIMDDFLKDEAPKLIDKAVEGLGKFADELKEALEEHNDK